MEKSKLLDNLELGTHLSSLFFCKGVPGEKHRLVLSHGQLSHMPWPELEP